MANPNDVVSIAEGALALIGLIGLPVAGLVVPITLLARGITGIFSKRKGGYEDV